MSDVLPYVIALAIVGALWWFQSAWDRKHRAPVSRWSSRSEGQQADARPMSVGLQRPESDRFQPPPEDPSDLGDSRPDQTGDESALGSLEDRTPAAAQPELFLLKPAHRYLLGDRAGEDEGSPSLWESVTAAVEKVILPVFPSLYLKKRGQVCYGELVKWEALYRRRPKSRHAIIPEIEGYQYYWHVDLEYCFETPGGRTILATKSVNFDTKPWINDDAPALRVAVIYLNDRLFELL
jgi:hypothetical protein